jgi:hypothetical protein
MSNPINTTDYYDDAWALPSPHVPGRVRICLWDDQPVSDITPARARALAAELLVAADRAEETEPEARFAEDPLADFHAWCRSPEGVASFEAAMAKVDRKVAAFAAALEAARLRQAKNPPPDAAA